MGIGVSVLTVLRSRRLSKATIKTVVLSKKDTASARALSDRLVREARQYIDLASAIKHARELAAIYRPENYEGVAIYAIHHAFALGTASMMLCESGAEELALFRNGNIWLRIPWEGWARVRTVNIMDFISELRARIAAVPSRMGSKTDKLETFDVRIFRKGERIMSISRNRDLLRHFDAPNIARHGNILMLANKDMRRPAISSIADECRSAKTLLVSDSEDEIFQFGPNASAIDVLPSPIAFMTKANAVPDAVVHICASPRDALLLREWARTGVRVFALSNDAGFDALAKELLPENFELMRKPTYLIQNE